MIHPLKLGVKVNFIVITLPGRTVNPRKRALSLGSCPLGPGVFTRYDINAYLAQNGTLVFYDPMQTGMYALTGDWYENLNAAQQVTSGADVKFVRTQHPNNKAILTFEKCSAPNPYSEGEYFVVWRLVKFETRESSKTITYKSFTNAQLEQSWSRLHIIDEITDSFGRKLSFTWKDQQVSGRWVIAGQSHNRPLKSCEKSIKCSFTPRAHLTFPSDVVFNGSVLLQNA